MKRPKLRTVEKYQAPYTINNFPKELPYLLGREIVYLLATRVTPRLEGSDWEEIFSRLIGGRWKPSNVGLDDVLLEQTAWSAKTVKATNPASAKKVRLISGRNSPTYSFDVDKITSEKPEIIGEMVLQIWNERVSSIRAKYAQLRTVILIKSDDLLELSLFEFDTIMYNSDDYEWSWNKRNNLEAKHKKTGFHQFTWQPHGSQFTIIEEIPEQKLTIRIKQPPPLDRDKVLETLDFDESWIEIVCSPKS